SMGSRFGEYFLVRNGFLKQFRRRGIQLAPCVPKGWFYLYLTTVFTTRFGVKKMKANDSKSVGHHLRQVRDGKRRFENAYQGVARMILHESAAIEKVLVNGRTTFDFRIFRISAKHVVGMYDEVNSFVSFIKDAAEGGSSREMAFVLVGEPGNGKTFFVDNLCALYRQFLASPGNRKYTFNYVHLDKLGGYGKIGTIQSQTFEDPVILAMNLFESRDEGKEFLAAQGDFSDQQIDLL